MADQTILSKWKALFPSQDPLSQPDQVGGMGMGESPSLLNYTLSPTRSKGEPATECACKPTNGIELSTLFFNI